MSVGRWKLSRVGAFDIYHLLLIEYKHVFKISKAAKNTHCELNRPYASPNQSGDVNVKIRKLKIKFRRNLNYLDCYQLLIK
jgi:hypothetical protein